MTKLLCNCLLWGRQGKRRIKQTAGVNLQQQTNHLCAHMWSWASFVRGISIKGFAHSHPLPGVILRQLVFAALTTNSNKDASVKAMVETSGDMQEQEEKISAPLKGSCSHEKPVWDPEGLGALGESSEAYGDSLCLEQQLGKREETAAALPQDIPCTTLFLSGYLTRVLKHGDDNACIITKLDPQRAQWPWAWVRQDNALQCTVWMYSSHGCCR